MMSDKKQRATKFKEEWIKILKAEDWLSQGSVDTKAKCAFCGEFSIGQQGISSVRQHAATGKHQVSYILNILWLCYTPITFLV